MQAKIISSLEKCFLDETIRNKPALKRASMLKNERFSFQVAYCHDPKVSRWSTRSVAMLEVESPWKEALTLRRVQSVPAGMPMYRNFADSDMLRSRPGLYPDALIPLESNRISVYDGLNALWVDVDGSKVKECGTFPVVLRFIPVHPATDEPRGEERPPVEVRLELEVIDALLPEQTTKVTQWFHCDCLQSFYGTEAFDERHWQLIENFMKSAVDNGVNMILTPLLTPPLDTFIGGERPTTQLVKITKEGEKYSFDFSLLERWVALCDKLGVKYFEINHMFTQWGASRCPKVMAWVDGEEKRIFGWDTEAAGEEYKSFLSQLIPAFLEKMKSLNGADKRCYFHVSDEPTSKHLESYKAARDVLLPLVKGYPVIDALSHVEYYDQGLVKIPVPGIEKSIDEFLKRDIAERWVYYCCGMAEGTSNRYMAFPSHRNRILGTQMYKFGIRGFLQWGYNFYYSQFSRALLDPWTCTDGDGFTPSGDCFSVYPGRDGSCVESLRLKVFYDALQDQRALELCESLYGREFTLALIDEGIEPLHFHNAPRTPEYLLHLRERVNAAIKAKIAK